MHPLQSLALVCIMLHVLSFTHLDTWFQQDQVYPKWHPPAWGGNANASPEEAWGRWAVARMWTLESTWSMHLYAFMILAFLEKGWEKNVLKGDSWGTEIHEESVKGTVFRIWIPSFLQLYMLPPFLGFCLAPPIYSSSRFQLFFCNTPSFWQLFHSQPFSFLMHCYFLLCFTEMQESSHLASSHPAREASARIATWSTVSPTRSIRWRSEVAGTCQFCPRCKKLHCKLPGWSPWRSQNIQEWIDFQWFRMMFTVLVYDFSCWQRIGIRNKVDREKSRSRKSILSSGFSFKVWRAPSQWNFTVTGLCILLFEQEAERARVRSEGLANRRNITQHCLTATNWISGDSL